MFGYKTPVSVDINQIVDITGYRKHQKRLTR